jgi:hypothetical protein
MAEVATTQFQSLAGRPCIAIITQTMLKAVVTTWFRQLIHPRPYIVTTIQIT